MYTITVKEGENSKQVTEIVLSGNLLVDMIPQIVNDLKELMNKHERFVFVLDEVDDVDLAFLQLMLSIEKTMNGQGKKLEKKINFPETFGELFTNTGFSAYID